MWPILFDVRKDDMNPMCDVNWAVTVFAVSFDVLLQRFFFFWFCAEVFFSCFSGCFFHCASQRFFVGFLLWFLFRIFPAVSFSITAASFSGFSVVVFRFRFFGYLFQFFTFSFFIFLFKIKDKLFLIHSENFI